MRSAKPPTISATVMIANVNWKVANADSGMVPLMASSPTPANIIFERPPTTGRPSSNARLYPTMSQRMVTTQTMVKHCISTLSTLRTRTRPA